MTRSWDNRKWQKIRRKMCAGRMARGEFDCPCCGRPMYFIKQEDITDYIERYADKFGKRPSEFPQELGQSLATVDHLFPRSRGGTDHPANLFVMCGGCNMEKDDMTAREWIAWRIEQGRPLDPIVTARLQKRARMVRTRGTSPLTLKPIARKA